MENLSTAEDEDPFSDADKWIAAQVRQLFRARRAEDEKAIEVTMSWCSASASASLWFLLPWKGEAAGIPYRRSENPSAPYLSTVRG